MVISQFRVLAGHEEVDYDGDGQGDTEAPLEGGGEEGEE
jgi:hypothetical protein